MKCHQGLVNAAHMFLDLKVTSKNASKKRHAFSNEVNYTHPSKNHYTVPRKMQTNSERKKSTKHHDLHTKIKAVVKKFAVVEKTFFGSLFLGAFSGI